VITIYTLSNLSAHAASLCRAATLISAARFSAIMILGALVWVEVEPAT
jgi:hypothetical protein